ncbi:hypothetical protein ACFL6M_03755 [Candidatus Eisenbacteria bacterium]|uniref:Uncharacterized protein n=1 Tax=Eiseniibacteriota bacterium TaxID=2212470 RepID=A0ABV6YK43_UNCEI
MRPFQDIQSREYTVEDIVQKTFGGVFGRKFWEFGVPAFLLTLLGVAASTGFTHASWSQMQQWSQSMDATGGPPDTALPTSPEFLMLYGRWLLVYVALSVPTIICVQYILHRMRCFILDAPEPKIWSLQRSLDPLRFFDFVVSGAIACVLIWIGSLFCFVPGIALSLVYMLLPVCLTFGQKRFRVPVKEPFQLIRTRFWKTVGTLIVIGIAFMILSWIVSLPLSGPITKSLRTLGANQDPTLYWEEYATQMWSPLNIGLGAVSALLAAVYWLFIGFASVVMYINYRADVLTPTEALPRTALRGVYERERLSGRTDLVRSDLAGDYGDHSDDTLLDIYQHIDAEAYQEKFSALLAEIKHRIEHLN